MLVEGLSRTGIFLIDTAGLVLSAVMLRGKIFGKATATAGVVGNGLMIVLEMILAFAPGWSTVWLIVAMCGGGFHHGLVHPSRPTAAPDGSG